MIVQAVVEVCDVIRCLSDDDDESSSRLVGSLADRRRVSELVGRRVGWLVGRSVSWLADASVFWSWLIRAYWLMIQVGWLDGFAGASYQFCE